jgi:hypothetical protein
MNEPSRVIVHVLRRNWWLPGGGLAVAVVAVLVSVIAARAPGSPEVVGLAAIVAAMGFVFAFATATRDSYPLARPAALAVTRDALEVGDHRIDAAEITEAKLVPKSGAHADTVAVLTLRSGERISLWMRRAEALQLLAHYGLGAGDARASFRLVTRFGTRFGVLYALFASPWIVLAFIEGPKKWLFGLFMGAVSGALFAFIPAALLGYVRGRLQIGADGFSIQWLWWRRLHRFADVLEVESRPVGLGASDVIVTLRDERRLRYRAPEQPDDDADRGAESRALLEHLAAAHARFSRRELEVDLRRQLERGGRSDDAWLADLDTLLRGGGARYRVATIEPDQVAVVVRDPLSSSEQRLAAAAALVRYDPAAYRGVVRRAADACAEVELRAAMEALAAAEDHAAVQLAFRKKRI